MIKRLKITLLLLLLAILVASEDQQEERNPISKLHQLRVTGAAKHMNSIIFLGGTGAGKSTLINLLAGVNLTVITSPSVGDKRYEIVHSTAEPDHAKIGQTVESQTIVPKFIPSKKDKDTAYFDTAGFSETRGFMVEVVHKYGIQLMLNITQKVKLVIVIDQLGLRNNKLKELIIQLGLNDQFSNSVGLIITKVQPDTTQEEIRTLLYQQITLIEKQGVKGIQLIKTAFALQNYVIFSTPERVDWMRTTLQKQRIKINKMIKEMSLCSSKVLKSILNVPQSYIMFQKFEETKKAVKRIHIENSASEVVKDFTHLQFQQNLLQLNQTQFYQKLHEYQQRNKYKKWFNNYSVYLNFYEYLDRGATSHSLIKLFRTSVFRKIIEYVTLNPIQKKKWYDRLYQKATNTIKKIFGYEEDADL